MKLIKKNWSKLVFLSYIFTVPIFNLYADPVTCPPGMLCNPLGDKATSIPDFIKLLLTGMLQAGIPIIALAVVYCGFLFVEARGNSEKLTKAKDALLYTLIGAAVLLGSWAIAQLISATIGGIAPS